MKVLKVFNNSIVLAEDPHGREVVLRGKGVGFQKSVGDSVDADLIEKQYLPSGATPVDRLARYLVEIPPAELAVTEDLVEKARHELDPSLHDHILFPLADHISFAIARVKRGESLDYPLKWEVTSLYPKEVAFARRALDDIEATLGVRLPDSEAVPLAMHFVTGQFSGSGMSTTMKVTDALSAAVRIVGDALGCDPDPESFDVSRFITHLRYLIARTLSGRTIPPLDPSVASALKAAHGQDYAIAGQIVAMLDNAFAFDIGENEVLYLTVHISRVSQALAAKA